MDSIFLNALWLNIQNSLIASFQATVLIFFPLASGVFFTFIFVKLLKSEVDYISLIMHGLVFSVFGLTVAYLYVGPDIGATAQILPAAIGATVVIFQMLGRLNPNWGVPLESHASLAGATAGVFCFLFGSVYFNALLVSEGKEDPPAFTTEPGETVAPQLNEPPISNEDAIDQINN